VAIFLIENEIYDTPKQRLKIKLETEDGTGYDPACFFVSM